MNWAFLPNAITLARIGMVPPLWWLLHREDYGPALALALVAGLSDALDGLNGALYSEAGQRWQGEALWQAIQTLPPATSPSVEQDHSALPPLYPR